MSATESVAAGKDASRLFDGDDATVVRGGSFSYVVSEARSSDRGVYTPSGRYLAYGFRLARTP